MPQYQITAASTPDYDEWGIDDYWSCEDWVLWHIALKKAYGLENANYIFLKSYYEAGSFASSYDCRTFNTTFKDYAKANSFYDNLFNGVGFIVKPIGIIIDASGNIIDIVSDGTDTIATLVKMLKTLLPIVLVIAIIMAIMYANKKYNIA